MTRVELRASWPGPTLREIEGDDMPLMFVRMAPLNQWAQIDSRWEGRFMERFAPGALLGSMVRDRAEIKSLFQHGRDPSIGSKVLGPITGLGEDERSAWGEVPLLDTEYNRELIPGLRANVYGASIVFEVLREEFRQSPGKSAYNPLGIPERTVREARLHEFGPVTWPAYRQGTSAGVRSLSDWFHFHYEEVTR